MRELAIEKERNRLIRQNAAFMIQSTWKKYLINRDKARKQKAKAVQRKEERRLVGEQ